MNLSRYEQETIISFNEAEQAASVYTHNKALRRKLDKLTEERPEDCRLARESRGGQARDYIVSKSWIKVSPPRRRASMTDEQREAAREQMRKINSERGKHDE